MKHWRPSPWPLVATLSAAALALAALNLAARLPAGDWWHAALQPDLRNPAELLVFYSFLPRLVTALLSGAALALAGVIFQQVMRNPLAEPGTLGVSAGASLALTLALVFAPSLLVWGQDAIALFGAALATLAVFGLAARRGFAPLALVLAGMIVALYCGAVGAGVQLFDDRALVSFYLWGAGSLSQQDWSVALHLLPRLAAAGVLAALIRRPLDLLGLDEAGARGLGLSPGVVRLAALTIAVGLSAVVVSAAGVIGFIGLAAPALARLAGARRLGAQMVVAPLIGAGVVGLTDQLVQWVSSGGRELVPTGAATALLGAPVLLWMLPRIRSADRAVPASEGDPSRLAARPWLLVVGATVVLAVLVVGSLHFGRTLHGWHWSTPEELAPLWRWRAPRLFGALAAGALLAIGGTVMQRMTGNPMAAPELLGIGSGAALGLILLLMLAPTAGRFTQLGAGAAGAAGALAIILLVGRRAAYAPERILLAGFAVGALSGVLLMIFMVGGDPRLGLLQSWLAGATDLTTPFQAAVACTIAALALLLAPFCRRWLEILPLGAETPRALGIDAGRGRLALLLLTALLTAVATLTIGPLGFVGLMGPHLARMMGLQRPLPQLFGAAVFGAVVMVAADWLGRTALFPYQVPAGLIATLIGGPYLMALLRRRVA